MVKSDKVISLTELSINPTFLEEVLTKAKTTRDKILLEEGCETFHLTNKKSEPNTLVMFAIYKSQKQYEWHLEQDYVKKFFSFLNGKLLSAPTANRLEAI